jgi:succinate dehydrogenase / fumarate reductase membrane anchor subunit
MATYSGVTHRKVQVQSVLIQHVLNDVHNLTLEVVAAVWSSWGWKVYDMLLLAFAIPHGVNGLRAILEEYIHNQKTIKALNVVLAIFVVVTLIWAGIAIASFNPDTVLN